MQIRGVYAGTVSLPMYNNPIPIHGKAKVSFMQCKVEFFLLHQTKVPFEWIDRLTIFCRYARAPPLECTILRLVAKNAEINGWFLLISIDSEE